MVESAAASVYALMASWLTPSALFIVINLVIGIIAITSRFATPKRRQFTPHGDDNLGSPQLVRYPSLLDRVMSFNLGLCKYEPPIVAETHCVEPAHNNQEVQDSPKLVRVPSLLERVKPFNLGSYKTEYSQPESEHGNHPEPQLARAPSLLERLKSVKLFRSESIGEEKGEVQIGGKDSGDGNGHLVEREAGTLGEEEEGVDAKADDFINRFKEQLRLQRLDSILRYREMLKGN